MRLRRAASESAGRIGRMCAAATNSRELRIAAVAELRAVVGFDSYAWLMTDPQTWVGSSPLADVPCLSELPTLIRLKYLTDANRWTGLPRNGLDCLHAHTEGDLGRSLVWAQMQKRFDVIDVASLAFIDRFGCWGFLDLWRSKPARPFSRDDAATLGHLVKPLTEGLRRTQSATFGSNADSPMLRHVEPAVLLMSGGLDVVAQTAQAEQYLTLLVPPEGGRGPVPAGAYNVAAQLLAVEAGIDGHPPRARVHIAGGTWLTLQAARIGDADGGASARAEIAVTIELASIADRAAIFARSHGFTDRETEILDQLLAGADSHELARSLFLSEHTIQDYLKAMFTKTGTRSRLQLISHVIGGTP